MVLCFTVYMYFFPHYYCTPIFFFVCGDVCLGFNKMKALILWESGVVEMGDV